MKPSVSLLSSLTIIHSQSSADPGSSTSTVEKLLSRTSAVIVFVHKRCVKRAGSADRICENCKMSEVFWLFLALLYYFQFILNASVLRRKIMTFWYCVSLSLLPHRRWPVLHSVFGRSGFQGRWLLGRRFLTLVFRYSGFFFLLCFFWAQSCLLIAQVNSGK